MLHPISHFAVAKRNIFTRKRGVFFISISHAAASFSAVVRLRPKWVYTRSKRFSLLRRLFGDPVTGGMLNIYIVSSNPAAMHFAIKSASCESHLFFLIFFPASFA